MIEIYFGISIGLSLIAIFLSFITLFCNYEDNKTLTLQSKLIVWLVKRQPNSTKNDFINKIIKILENSNNN